MPKTHIGTAIILSTTLKTAVELHSFCAELKVHSSWRATVLLHQLVRLTATIKCTIINTLGLMLIITTLGLRKKIHPSWRKTECSPD